MLIDNWWGVRNSYMYQINNIDTNGNGNLQLILMCLDGGIQFNKYTSSTENGIDIVSNRGSYNRPIVLYSGLLTKISNTSSNPSWISFSKLITVSGISSLTCDVTEGKMTISINMFSGYKINVYSVHATQAYSKDTDNTTSTYEKHRNTGAHWFECRTDSCTNTKYIYIREFHQEDQNNDTWMSSNFNYLHAVNLTLIGFIEHT